MPAPMMPLPAAMPAVPLPPLSPQQLSAAASSFAPAFTALPSSFLGAAFTPGAVPGMRMDPSMLLGSAFPGLRAGAPAYLGYDPASAVTTTSQIQALPVDGLSSTGGVGLPVLLAVLILAGVAAYAVRRSVVGPRVSTVPAGTAPADAAAPKVAAPAAAAAVPAVSAPISKPVPTPTGRHADRTGDPEATAVVGGSPADPESTALVPATPADAETTAVVHGFDDAPTALSESVVEKTVITSGARIAAGTAGV
jgi:hypothetical protein